MRKHGPSWLILTAWVWLILLVSYQSANAGVFGGTVNYKILTPPKGYEWCTPLAMNSHGVVVGILGDLSRDFTLPTGFIYSEGRMTVVRDARFDAINDNNVIAGYVVVNRKEQLGLINFAAATFDIKGNSRVLGPPGYSRYTCISNTNIVVGQSITQSKQGKIIRQLFSYSHGIKKYLPLPPGGVGASAEFVDDHGNIAGYVLMTVPSSGRTYHVPAVWLEGECQTFPTPDGFTSGEAHWVDEVGNCACESNYEWPYGTMFKLGLPFMKSETYFVRAGSADCEAWSVDGSKLLTFGAVSSNGLAVGTFRPDREPPRPWYASSMVGPPRDISSLFPVGGRDINPKAISMNGTVVGKATIDGSLQGFMIDLPVDAGKD